MSPDLALLEALMAHLEECNDLRRSFMIRDGLIVRGSFSEAEKKKIYAHAAALGND